MIELEDEIKDIKKEIIESRNLGIRTENAVKNFSADIKQIQRKQESYEKKYIFTSVVAYLIFVGIMGAGAYFLVEARTEKLKAENAELVSKDSGVKAKIAELEGQLKARGEASTQAMKVYKSLKKGVSAEALADFDSVRGRGLSDLEQLLLTELVGSKRIEIARVEYEEGRRFLNRKEYEKAEEAYRKSLAHAGATKETLLTDVLYDLGTTLHKLKKYADSTSFFERMLQRSTDAQRNGEATYLIAANAELTAQPDKAKEGYLKFIQYFSKHKWMKQAKQRLKKLQ